MENECKTTTNTGQYSTLNSFSIKNIFYDKMNLRLFYFHVTNYNKSDKPELKIFSNFRGSYLYGTAKPRDITLNIIQQRTSLVSFYQKFQIMM